MEEQGAESSSESSLVGGLCVRLCVQSCVVYCYGWRQQKSTGATLCLQVSPGDD